MKGFFVLTIDNYPDGWRIFLHAMATLTLAEESLATAKMRLENWIGHKQNYKGGYILK